MRKGQLVKVNIANSFTKDAGGARQRPILGQIQDKLREVPGFSKYNHDEKEKIQALQPLHNLPPLTGLSKNRQNYCYYNPLKVDKLYVCIRSRTKFEEDGVAKTGFCLLLDTRKGDLIYVRREYLEVVNDS